MSPKEDEEERKKKPKISYEVSEDGRIIDASIDGKTHFISIRRTIESKKGGGVAIMKLGGEVEKAQRDEWTSVVWEDGETMPESVWSEKRRKELIQTIANTITTITGSKQPIMSGFTGTVIPWRSFQLKKCEDCQAQITSESEYCSNCGKHQP